MVKAFTIAEVLIALGIIGLVAAMTIPTLLQKSNEREIVSHFLKQHNTLSNAFKETEALLGMKVDRMDWNTFKTEFESHLKTIPCDNPTENKVCLNDMGIFEYGTFDSNCPDEVCMEITLDANGKKYPNKAGKDIYTLLVTTKGIRALGDSNTCETGMDCGAYVLAHHKLWNGEINNSNSNNSFSCGTGLRYIDGECIKLLENCKNISDDNLTCNNCSNGYSLSNGNCAKVSIEHCTNYSGTQCIGCEDGFYAKSGGCYATTGNLENCGYAYNTTSCYRCKDGYALLNGVCVLNNSNDENCSTLSDESTCSNCKAGHYFSNGKCVENPTCQYGYRLNSSTHVCEEKTPINNPNYDSNCANTGGPWCVECIAGYYLNTAGNSGKGSCISLDNPVNNCSNYDNNGLCKQCFDGYVLYKQNCYEIE